MFNEINNFRASEKNLLLILSREFIYIIFDKHWVIHQF